MPQAQQQKVTNTFIKGLITEAGELTFPPDASIDESNCDLRRDGSRKRREGVKFEDQNSLSSFTVRTDQVVSSGDWYNVGGVSDKEYLVVQTGNTLHFYDKLLPPFSSHEVASTIDLSAYEFAGSPGAANTRCEYTSTNGVLVVASEAIDTIFIEETTAGVIQASVIPFRIRDFQYQSDRESLTGDILTADVTVKRKYDTQNSGWVGGRKTVTTTRLVPEGEGEETVDVEVTTTESVATQGAAALDLYIAAESAYPALSLPWFSGKTAAGDFSVAEWKKIFGGTSLISNGHFILDFFEQDRTAVSGLMGLTVRKENTRFTTVASFAGRVFYSGLSSAENGSSILFCRQLEATTLATTVDTAGLGDCYQINDPTSEDFSDLIDTDGGVIRIPEAIKIKRLHPFNNSLFVFAENGVWQVKGSQDIFRATEFAVNKITSVGLSDLFSFASADGSPFWWSEYGIHTLGFDSQTFQPSENNLSIGTVQTFFDGISLESRRRVSSVFDRVNKRIMWFYPNNGEPTSNKLNNVLLLDLPLQAFYPWSISDQSSDTSSIVGTAFYRGFGVQQIKATVIDESGNNVVTVDGDSVYSFLNSGFDTGDPTVVLLLRDGASGKLSMGSFSDETFLDWGTADYTSYAEAGYNFMGDLMTSKTAPYLQVFMRVTETGWTGDGLTGYEPIRPSSLLVSSFWDFSNNPSSEQQQAYRLKFPVVVDPSRLNSFDYPTTVVDTRLKIRGSGKSVRLRFESETGKDFNLLGYGEISGRNPRY